MSESKQEVTRVVSLVKKSEIIRSVSGLLYPFKPASMAQLDAPSDWRPGGHGFNPR